MNEAFFEIRGRVKQERINKFVEELGAYMSGLNDVQLEIDQITREDFGDFFEALLRNVALNRSEQKRIAFRNILINQLTKPRDMDYAELNNDLLASLNENQILILQSFNKLTNSSFIDLSSELASKKQERTDIKREINMPGKYFDDDGERSNDPDLSLLENNLKRVDREIAGLQKRIDAEAYPSAKDFEISETDYYYLIQDLCNKGLMIDRSAIANEEPLILIEITEIGINLVDFIQI